MSMSRYAPAPRILFAAFLLALSSSCFGPEAPIDEAPGEAQSTEASLYGPSPTAYFAISPDEWSFEVCADDVRLFCDALEIRHPIVLGHSMGGFVVALYGARHPSHAQGLVLQSTTARQDLERLVEGFRRVGGDGVAEIASRVYGDGEKVPEGEWSRCFAAFGPVAMHRRPHQEQEGHRRGHRHEHANQDFVEHRPRLQ